MSAQDARLAPLAKKIKAEHKAIKRHSQCLVEHVMRIGKLLEEVENIPHGNTKREAKAGKIKFIEEDCGVPYNTARRWLKYWKERDKWLNESTNLVDLTLTAIDAQINYFIWREQFFAKDEIDKAVISRKHFEREMRNDKEFHDAHKRLSDRDTILNEWYNLFYDICRYPDEEARQAVVETIHHQCDEYLNAPDQEV